MPASVVTKTFADGTISLKDGTGTPVVFTSAFSQGDFTASGLEPDQRAATAYEARGVLKSIRLGARSYPTGSFSVMMTDVSDAGDDTLVDFVLKQNGYSGNISTTAAAGDAYTVTITLTIEGTDHGDAADHAIELADCRCTVDVAEGEPNTVTVSFTCYGSVTMT